MKGAEMFMESPDGALQLRVASGLPGQFLDAGSRRQPVLAVHDAPA
jgi:hypothetical protein